jgi:hypothetical protein
VGGNDPGRIGNENLAKKHKYNKAPGRVKHIFQRLISGMGTPGENDQRSSLVI